MSTPFVRWERNDILRCPLSLLKPGAEAFEIPIGRPTAAPLDKPGWTLRTVENDGALFLVLSWAAVKGLGFYPPTIPDLHFQFKTLVEGECCLSRRGNGLPTERRDLRPPASP